MGISEVSEAKNADERLIQLVGVERHRKVLIVTTEGGSVSRKLFKIIN